MADKVRELAEKLQNIARHVHVGHDWTLHFERILRAELKPLLDAAEARFNSKVRSPKLRQRLKERLATELEGWATQRGGNSDTEK